MADVKIQYGYGCIPFLFFPYFGLKHIWEWVLLIGKAISHLRITQKDEAVQLYNEIPNRQFRTYFCAASFHFDNRSITFISHL